MRQNLPAMFLAFCLSPLTAFAGTAGSPCNLVDKEALAALKFGEAKMNLERKNIPATKEAPALSVDTCVITPRDTPLPSLSVTTALLPAGAKTVKLTCSEQSFPGVKVNICNATIKGGFATFALVTPSASDLSRTFRSQLERLVDGPAAAGTQATATK